MGDPLKEIIRQHYPDAEFRTEFDEHETEDETRQYELNVQRWAHYFDYCVKALSLGLGETRASPDEYDQMEVFLLPGFAENNRHLGLFRENLEEQGIHTSIDNNFSNIYTPPFEQLTKRMKFRVEESKARVKVLCGHSNGGRVAFGTLNILQPETRENTFAVTMGTPWCGSPLATKGRVLGGGQALMELETYSDVTEYLKGISAYVKSHVISIASKRDKVAPVESAVLEGARLNVLLQKGKHIDFLYDPRIANLVAATIKYIFESIQTIPLALRMD